jgi:hypothetical protein
LFSRSCTQLQNPTIRAKNEPKAFVMKNLAKLKTASSETELKDIVATAAKYGGIQLGPFTRHVSAYKKKARVVPAGVWSTLANTKFEHGDLCPHLLQSVLMACASCPEGVVTGKDLKLNMTKHKDDMLQIEEIIMVSIGMLKDMKLDRAVETKEVNLFRCSLVLKFLDKSSVQIAKATYLQVASDFYNACIAANKLDAQQKNPFERFRAIAESSSKDEADDNPPTRSLVMSIFQALMMIMSITALIHMWFSMTRMERAKAFRRISLLPKGSNLASMLRRRRIKMVLYKQVTCNM